MSKAAAKKRHKRLSIARDMTAFTVDIKFYSI
jgi:hypothetical protein